MTRSLGRLVAVATACVLMSACGSESSVAPVTMASVAGTYNLKTYNGLALPAVVRAADPKVEVLDDQVIVKTDGSWTELGNFRVTDAAGVNIQTETGAGTYTLNGSVASFRSTSLNGDVTMVTFSGSSFTISASGATLIYSR